MERILITGAAGFAGSHLIDYLLDRDCPLEGQMVGLDLPSAPLDNVGDNLSEIAWVKGDITQKSLLIDVLRAYEPTVIFHLAARAFVPDSWLLVDETIQTNVAGTANLFEAVRLTGLDPIIQVACSSEEYGHVDDADLPIVEGTPFKPLSPYGVSKVATDMLAYQYFKSYGLRTIRTRTFNHCGPRQKAAYVCSAFVKRALLYQARRLSVFEHGDMNPYRDFTDGRDVVRAYVDAVMKGTPGEVYVVTSGNAKQIRELYLLVCQAVGLDPDSVVRKETFVRPSDVPFLNGFSAKFHAATGWVPEIPFEQTIDDLVGYWRVQLDL